MLIGGNVLRDSVQPYTFGTRDLSETSKENVFLSDFEPDYIEQITGLPEKDRSFWGNKLLVNGTTYSKGISVFPNSEVVYKTDGKWQTFSAVLCGDFNFASGLKKENYQGGKLQFGIYGDDYELFVSRPMDANSKPQEVNISIAGVKVLKLIVRTQDWLPYFVLCGNWVNVKVGR